MASDTAGLRRGLVETEILDEAARLFAARGYAATSMQDIATALGTSRPALYHYFAGKEEILARLLGGLTQATRQAVSDAAGIEGGSVARLHGLVRALIAPIAAAPSRFRLLLTSDLAEQLDVDGQLSATRRDVVHAVSAAISDGMAEGVFRRTDPTVATFGTLGLINWVAWWYSPSRGPHVDELSTQLADMAVASLRTSPAEPGAVGVPAVFAAIRRELDFLERTLPNGVEQ